MANPEIDHLKRQLASGIKGAEYRAALAKLTELQEQEKKQEACCVCGRPVGEVKLGICDRLGRCVGRCCSRACWTDDSVEAIANGAKWINDELWITDEKTGVRTLLRRRFH